MAFYGPLNPWVWKEPYQGGQYVERLYDPLLKNVETIATRYRTGDSLPLMSLPTASASRQLLPCSRISVRCKTQYAIAAINSTTPYKAVGAGAKWFSPIHPVANGISDNQNSRCEFAHMMEPCTRRAAWSIW